MSPAVSRESETQSHFKQKREKKSELIERQVIDSVGALFFFFPTHIYMTITLTHFLSYCVSYVCYTGVRLSVQISLPAVFLHLQFFTHSLPICLNSSLAYLNRSKNNDVSIATNMEKIHFTKCLYL